MRRPLLTATVLLFASAARAQDPLLSLEVRPPVAELRAALASEPVRAVFGSLPWRRLSGTPILAHATRLRSLLVLTASSWPRRVRFVAPAETAAGLVATLRLLVALEACSASAELQGADRDAFRSLLDPALLASIRGLQDLRFALRLEWERERSAERAFESITDSLALLASGAAVPELRTTLHIERADDTCLLRLDLDRLFDSAAGRVVLQQLGVLTGSEGDPFLDRLILVAREPDLEFAITRQGPAVDLRVGPRGRQPRFADAGSPDETDDAVLRCRWSLGALATGLADHEVLLRRLQDLASQKGLADLETDCADWRALVGRWHGMPRSGRALGSIEEDGWRWESWSAPTGREVRLADTALLDRIPAGVELYYATGASDPVAALRDAAIGIADQADRQIWRDEGAPAAETAAMLRRACLQLARDLGRHAGVFRPGWALVLSTDGEIGIPEGVLLCPALAILARPESTEAGLALAGDLLGRLAQATGHEVLAESGEIRLAPREGGMFPDGREPVAFVHGDLLVVSTSDELAARIRSTREPIAEAGERISMLETSGRRLGMLALLGGNLLRRWTGDVLPAYYGEALAEAIGLIGSLHADSELREGTVHTGLVVHTAAAEAAGQEELLQQVRERLGIGHLGRNRMLVAEGQAVYLGQQGRLEFCYGPRGELRETVRTPVGIDVVYETGDTVYQDAGGGMVRTDNAGDVRSWAAAVTGQWAMPETGFSARLLDRTRNEITFGFRCRHDLVERSIAIDAVSMLPRSFSFSAVAPRSRSAEGLTLSDYRRVGDMMLPHRVSTTADNDYRIERWQIADLDRERFRGRHAPRFAFARGAEPLVFEVSGDWVVAAGRVAGRAGLIGITPMRNVSWIDDDVVPEPEEGNTDSVTVKDIRVGPLHAEQFAFIRTSLGKVRGEQILAILGSDALQGCCVRVGMPDFRTEILPPGSFSGGGFWPMTEAYRHRVLRCRLAGGVESWWAPVVFDDPLALLHPQAAREWLALGRGGPFGRRLHLQYVELAGFRAEPRSTPVLPVSEPVALDPTPIALSTALLRGLTLELDFPNARYRMTR